MWLRTSCKGLHKCGRLCLSSKETYNPLQRTTCIRRGLAFRCKEECCLCLALHHARQQAPTKMKASFLFLDQKSSSSSWTLQSLRLLFLFFSDLIKNLLSEGSLLVLRRGQIVRLATQDYNDVDVDMRIVATLASILSFSLTQET